MIQKRKILQKLDVSCESEVLFIKDFDVSGGVEFISAYNIYYKRTILCVKLLAYTLHYCVQMFGDYGWCPSRTSNLESCFYFDHV